MPFRSTRCSWWGFLMELEHFVWQWIFKEFKSLVTSPWKKNSQARRVVESHYPGVEHIEDVAGISYEEVKKWSLRYYSQCNSVLMGAGPPCQGVSGLNTDRRGALRSSLFSHVPRIRDLVRSAFMFCGCKGLKRGSSALAFRHASLPAIPVSGRALLGQRAR